MNILNLTQHLATPAQREAGVFDLDPNTREELKRLLTFDELPTKEQVETRAIDIADLAKTTQFRYTDAPGWFDSVMIGGAPFLMGALEDCLCNAGLSPLFAFSKRVSVERQEGNTGRVMKASEFQHQGFVDMSSWK